MDRDSTYKLDELARAADVSPRTVRYYVQRGLLPAPEFRGRDTVYTAEHLERLRAIRKLQDEYLPLDAIQAELGQKSAGEIVKMPRRAPSATTWQRHLVRDGVEIHVREDVAASMGNLVEELAQIMKEKGPYR